MVVLMVEKVTPGLRGELTRWMVQPQTGVFVGRIPARVRDLLWQKVVARAPQGRAVMVYQARNEQGFAIRKHGESRRKLVDLDGLTLVKIVTSR